MTRLKTSTVTFTFTRAGSELSICILPPLLGLSARTGGCDDVRGREATSSGAVQQAGSGGVHALRPRAQRDLDGRAARLPIMPAHRGDARR